MVQTTPDANFTSLSGSALRSEDLPEYREYRRQWQEFPKNFTLRDYPIHLDVEATNRCNLRCTFCDKLPIMTADQMGDMSMDLYKRIIDESSERRLYGLKLSYRGESLLHPKIDEMVGYAKKSGVLDVYFNTNGMLLTASMSRRLIDSGLDRVSVSVEGTDPVAFEKARRGARFDRIRRNIETLIEIREKAGAMHPKVRVQTVKLPEIDLDDYGRFWGGRCDEVAAIDYKDVENREETLVDPNWACPQLWQRMTIEWDGTVMPCNNDDFRRLSPGNVREMSVAECWKAPIVEQTRSAHQDGASHRVSACNGCPWRTTQILKIREEEDA